MSEVDTDEAEFIPISALQHYVFCPRQCALIHLDRRWRENRLTAQGRVLHDRVDTGLKGLHKGSRIERNVPLISFKWGLRGFADVVEVRNESHPYPIEYKRGRRKTSMADEIQLCAQTLCLEEMMGTNISEGAIFYGQERRRKEVCFDDTLRKVTLETVSAVKNMFKHGQTPKSIYSNQKCSQCSLIEVCQPKMSATANSVSSWLNDVISDL